MTYFNITEGVATPQLNTGIGNLTVVEGTQKLSVTEFNNCRDNHPKTISCTWAELCTEFRKHPARSQKDGPAWSPVSYFPGSTRGNASVDQVFLAVIDVDDGTAMETVLERFTGFALLAHSSFSHSLEKPKYRVILPLETPIPASEWRSTWDRINLMAGGCNDPATKDPARLYFKAAHPTGTDFHFVRVVEGRFLAMDDLPVPVEPQEIPSTSTSRGSRSLGSHPVIEGIESHEELGFEEGLREVVDRCSFMKFAAAPENQPHLPEPLWMAMISNACRFEKSEGWIHEASKHHPDYQEAATNKKIAHALNGPAPITCQRIAELGFQNCPQGGCKRPNGESAKAPAGLSGWMFKSAGHESAMPAKKQKRKDTPLVDSVNEFVAKYFSGLLRFINGRFLAYDNGYWRTLDEQVDVRRLIAMFLGEDATPDFIGSMLSLAKDLRSTPEIAIPRDQHLLCLNNGTLNLSTGELLEHSPTHNLRTGLGIDWDSEATCPRWEQFLEEIFQNDPDKIQRKLFLQEWFGYCLTTDTTQHKFLWMVGKGGNGKSVVLSILAALAGHDNVSHAQIERLENKFVRAELEGKLVNISSEMSASATISDGYLKAIVASDIIEAERKFQPSFSFRPFVHLVGATNELPRLLDLSDGFIRRAIILTFNRQFSESEQDRQLESTLLRELPGILNWSVRGYQRLLERKNFDIPMSSIAAVRSYRDEADVVKLFASECIKNDMTGPGESSATVYSSFREWCLRSGFQPMTIINFGRRFSALGYSKRKSGNDRFWQVESSPYGIADHGVGNVAELPKVDFLEGHHI